MWRDGKLDRKEYRKRMNDLEHALANAERRAIGPLLDERSSDTESNSTK